MVLLAGLFAATAGCAHDEELSIPPLPAAEGRVNPGLGAEARPLSSGPGYKGSPSWAPGGERVAFLMDGYVVDRTVDGEEVTRWTTRDFVAEEAEWTGDEALTVLGATDSGSGDLYRTYGEASLGLEKTASGVLAVSPGPGRRQVLLALKLGRGEGGIALLQGGRVERVYKGIVGGRITGLFPSPDGKKVALAVRPAGGRLANELHFFDLNQGEDHKVSDLDDQGILGAPQWTDDGIYFVAGSNAAVEGGEPRYELYRAGPEPGDPEPAPGVGEDFVAGSVRVSPDGGRLAVVGRLN
ncbi:MAG: hypothetical protein H0V28_06285, partial [Rubrobacteraceae bacterium]|nr:hypothetical protein [Rubrobacteraceae bacterium]